MKATTQYQMLYSGVPTIASELDYGALEVKHGGDAQAAWLEATDPACDPQRREALEEALRAYCARDTWAMVTVARALAGG
ncbi:MAG TPA: hypothetical protein VNJ04_12430 [Gemmatimonadaceae bacterium]|nr:hypothetical protein [Gemmatimonadaceae bacterium]